MSKLLKIKEAMQELRDMANYSGPYELRPKNQLHAFVFDNGGETVDRYTVYLRTSPEQKFAVFTMSADPWGNPQGVNMYSHDVDTPAGIEDMAQAIRFDDIPFAVVLAIVDRAI